MENYLVSVVEMPSAVKPSGVAATATHACVPTCGSCGTHEHDWVGILALLTPIHEGDVGSGLHCTVPPTINRHINVGSSPSKLYLASAYILKEQVPQVHHGTLQRTPRGA